MHEAMKPIHEEYAQLSFSLPDWLDREGSTPVEAGLWGESAYQELSFNL